MKNTVQFSYWLHVRSYITRRFYCPEKSKPVWLRENRLYRNSIGTGCVQWCGLGLIGFPHIEIAIPALLLSFLAFYTRGQWVAAALKVLILLSVIEDAGLHAFLIMACVIAAILLQHRILSIGLLAFALIALCYSLVIIYIQKSYFLGDNTLARIYTGTTAYEHITLGFMVANSVSI